MLRNNIYDGQKFHRYTNYSYVFCISFRALFLFLLFICFLLVFWFLLGMF